MELPPFSLAEAVSRWQFAPVVTGFVVAAAGLYLWGVLRVRRRHPARPWPLYRTALFLSGLAVVVIATQSGIGTYDDVLFYDHMMQHLLLLMVAPPLLVVGQPATLLLHASRNPLHTWAKKVLRSGVVAAITRERSTFLVQVCSGFRLACSSSVAGWPTTSSGGATMRSSRCCTM